VPIPPLLVVHLAVLPRSDHAAERAQKVQDLKAAHDSDFASARADIEADVAKLKTSMTSSARRSRTTQPNSAVFQRDEEETLVYPVYNDQVSRR
jgi:Skp family chaperone for outer membrane proteins